MSTMRSKTATAFGSHKKKNNNRDRRNGENSHKQRRKKRVMLEMWNTLNSKRLWPTMPKMPQPKTNVPNQPKMKSRTVKVEEGDRLRISVPKRKLAVFKWDGENNYDLELVDI